MHLNLESVRNATRQGQHLERFLVPHGVHGLRARVGDPKVCKLIRVGEALEGLVGEDAVRAKGADALGAVILQHLPALDERPAGLHEIVHDDAVLTLRVRAPKMQRQSTCS